MLAGFTLTSGATGSFDYPAYDDWDGGGVWCASVTAVVSNCVLALKQANGEPDRPGNGFPISFDLVRN
jgi:hypothetical protein